MKFKNLIKKYRKSLGLTQTELAYLVGVSKNAISLYENFKMIPTSDVAFKLLFVFIKKYPFLQFTDLFYFVDEE